MFERLTGAALGFIQLDSAGGPLYIVNSSNITEEPLLKMSVTKVIGFLLGLFKTWIHEIM